MREIETRYRVLFDASTEAIVLLKADSLKMTEANPAALRLIGLQGEKAVQAASRDFLGVFAREEREALRSMLIQVRENGKAPGVLVHLGEAHETSLVRASLVRAGAGPFLLLQLLPAGNHRLRDDSDVDLIATLVDRAPDGFVVLDKSGTIQRTNRAFLDFVEAGGAGSVVGEPFGRWLCGPGADASVLLAHLKTHGAVRLFSSALQGDVGGVREVEISSAGNADDDSDFYGLVVRDVGRRLSRMDGSGRDVPAEDASGGQVGRTPLRTLVKDAVDGVERRYVKAALDLAGGNRTAAAELLGLSRQSLYVKLNRYGLDDPQMSSDKDGG